MTETHGFTVQLTQDTINDLNQWTWNGQPHDNTQQFAGILMSIATQALTRHSPPQPETFNKTIATTLHNGHTCQTFEFSVTHDWCGTETTGNEIDDPDEVEDWECAGCGMPFTFDTTTGT